MDRLAEAVEIAIGHQRDLMFDPITALLVLAIVLAFGVARLLGWRKSTRQRIAEMEDAEFPEDAVDAASAGPDRTPQISNDGSNSEIEPRRAQILRESPKSDEN